MILIVNWDSLVICFGWQAPAEGAEMSIDSGCSSSWAFHCARCGAAFQVAFSVFNKKLQNLPLIPAFLIGIPGNKPCRKLTVLHPASVKFLNEDSAVRSRFLSLSIVSKQCGWELYPGADHEGGCAQGGDLGDAAFVARFEQYARWLTSRAAGADVGDDGAFTAPTF